MKKWVTSDNIEAIVETLIYKYGYLSYLKSNSIHESPYHYYKSSYTVDELYMKMSYESLEELIITYDKRYSFLFSVNWYILDPKDFTQGDLFNLESVLSEKRNYFFLLAYLMYKKNRGDLTILDEFESIISLDPLNYHLKLEYARYKWSSLYKINIQLNHHYLKEALIDVENCIKALRKDNSMLTFPYAWLGFLNFSLKNYEIAVKFYDYALLKSSPYSGYEPLFWKALSLFDMGDTRGSFGIVQKLLTDNSYLPKRDFKFYIFITRHYLLQKNSKMACKNFAAAIEKYLEVWKFNIDDTNILSKKNHLLKYKNRYLNNQFNSYLLYYKDKKFLHFSTLMLSLSFIYKQKKISNLYEVDLRWFDKVAYNLLILLNG